MANINCTNMERYYVINKDYTDLSNGLIDLNDFDQKVHFNIGDKIVLQDNNRSYNSSYFNANYYKYIKIVEVDYVSSKRIRFIKVYEPIIALNIKNGYHGYFEQSIDKDFKSFRTVIRTLSTGEFNSILLHMKYLNHNIGISELLDQELGPRLFNTVKRFSEEKNIQYVKELVLNFGSIRQYSGLGIEGHKLLSRKISALYQSRLNNAVPSEINKNSLQLNHKKHTQVNLDNLRNFMIERGSARIANRIEEIISAVKEVGLDRVFGLGKVRGLGKKSLRELVQLVKEYDPEINYINGSDEFPLTIEGVIFEEKPSIDSLRDFFNEDMSKSYNSCCKIARKIFGEFPSQHSPDVVDLTTSNTDFIMFHGFIEISPISFFIINRFFPWMLNLSKERIRQVFFTESLKRPILVKHGFDRKSRRYDFDQFGYQSIDDDFVIDMRNVAKLSSLKGNTLVTDKIFDFKYQGKRQRLIFDSEGFNRIEEVLSESVLLSNQVISIIEGFVELHESTGVTTSMIIEDLEDYNLIYSSSQINDMCRLKSTKLTRRLNKSWVIKDGPCDIDPDFNSYSDWFKFLIEDGKSPIEAIGVVRRFYPDYKLRNFVSLIQNKLGKDFKSYDFIMLSSEPFGKEYLKKLRKVLLSPGLLQSESISWPYFWFHYIEKISVSIENEQHHLVFKCKDFKSFEDFKTIIESFAWRAKVKYKYDEE